MNILYMTQSGLLRVFHGLHSALENIQSFDRVGFYVTDSLQFQRYISETPQFLEKGFSVTKEWDIVNDARTVQVDYSKLKAIEKRIGKPYLSDALTADRRITFGPYFADIQNYSPRFNHDEMTAILQVALERLEALFDEVRPSLVLTFQCLTIGDYLSFLLSSARGIPFLNLRPTKNGQLYLCCGRHF